MLYLQYISCNYKHNTGFAKPLLFFIQDCYHRIWFFSPQKIGSLTMEIALFMVRLLLIDDKRSL